MSVFSFHAQDMNQISLVDRHILKTFMSPAVQMSSSKVREAEGDMHAYFSVIDLDESMFCKTVI